jgi:hypothetical protein
MRGYGLKCISVHHLGEKKTKMKNRQKSGRKIEQFFVAFGFFLTTG